MYRRFLWQREFTQDGSEDRNGEVFVNNEAFMLRLQCTSIVLIQDYIGGVWEYSVSLGALEIPLLFSYT
jgi:hypothetical protein